jgi:hypothetical protein
MYLGVNLIEMAMVASSYIYHVSCLERERHVEVHEAPNMNP